MNMLIGVECLEAAHYVLMYSQDGGDIKSIVWSGRKPKTETAYWHALVTENSGNIKEGEMSDSVYWDQGTRGWIANIARAELWRVPSWYSLDDLIQDGAMCFCKCLKTYATNPPSKTFVDEKGIERTLDGHAVAYVAPGKLPTDLQRQHFMALVRTAFTNHINTLSSRRTASCDEVLVSQISDVDSPDPLAAFAPLLEPDAPLFAAIKQAPAELAELIVKLTQDGFEAGTYLRTRLRHRGERVQLGRVGLRETTREHWDRVLGEIGVVDRVTDFITS